MKNLNDVKKCREFIEDLPDYIVCQKPIQNIISILDKLIAGTLIDKD